MGAVSFDAAACDAYCEKKLYFMRQVRARPGQGQDRVERFGADRRREAAPGAARRLEGTR